MVGAAMVDFGPLLRHFASLDNFFAPLTCKRLGIVKLPMPYSKDGVAAPRKGRRGHAKEGEATVRRARPPPQGGRGHSNMGVVSKASARHNSPPWILQEKAAI